MQMAKRPFAFWFIVKGFDPAAFASSSSPMQTS